MTGPKRIQLRRTRGWRMPEGALKVVQVANWADVARAVREKPTGAEIQQWATYHRETL